MKTDEAVKNKLAEQLEWNDAIDNDDITVEVSGQKVYLKGSVSSYSAKVFALRDALQIAPEYQVKNDLTVKFGQQQPTLDDTEITGNIQGFYKWNSNINPAGISVETKNGEVTLSGKVAKSWEKSEAEKIAGSAKGVVNVVNLIEVKPNAIRSDEYIVKDLKRTFERSSLIDESNVHVNVENGVVHLTGSVVSVPVLNEINEKALYTNGVVDVVNEITVQ